MNSDPRDYKLDLSSDVETDAPSSDVKPRPFLSVHFACCGVYQRIYRDAAGTSYHGRCPRCGTPVRFAVGQGGTASRCFRVS